MDANVALALAVKLSYSNHAATKMAAWQAQGGELFVPTLWAYEIVSGLRKIVTAGALSTADAQTRLEALLALEIQIVPPSLELNRRALMWSQKIGQSAAYDAQYLALAEQLNAELWTADGRLANGVQTAGADWVHKLGSPSILSS